MDELLREFLTHVDAQLVPYPLSESRTTARFSATFSVSFIPLRERATFSDCRGSRRSRTPPKR